jgi:predicted dehydrogenase
LTDADSGPHRPGPHRPGPGRLRWGIAGYGDVVRRRGQPAFAALRQDIACVWGRDRSRATAAAASYGAAHGTDNFDALLDRCDAVYIATPVVAHVPLALAAIDAGLHVLVEKPLGGGLRYDSARLLAGARAARVVTGVAYYRRLAPALLTVRDQLASGPYRVLVRFRAAFSPAPADPMYWRTVSSVSGGGVLADAGSHRIDLLCWLFGAPGRVQGTLGGEFPGGAERRASVDLGWAGGTTARLRLDWAGGPGLDSLTCVGADRVIRLPQLDSGWVIEHNGREIRRFLPPEPNALIPVLRDFLQAVEGDGLPSCSLSDGVVVDDVIRAASERGADRQ